MAKVAPQALAPDAASGTNGEAVPGSRFWVLTLGSLGVVYGDIGTSPLYAFREAVVAASESGAVLRADNNGEGGTLSLMALAYRGLGRRAAGVSLIGIVGASMFLGDSVITPAISVLSAVEGLKVATPAFHHLVLPLTVAILIALFAVQQRGTARVAAFFGPVMVVWFAALAVSGLIHIRDDPGVLWAIDPSYGV